MSLPSLMARKNESPQKATMRDMMRSYLKDKSESTSTLYNSYQMLLA